MVMNNAAFLPFVAPRCNYCCSGTADFARATMSILPKQQGQIAAVARIVTSGAKR
jgi:hypothetical protein